MEYLDKQFADLVKEINTDRNNYDDWKVLADWLMERGEEEYQKGECLICDIALREESLEGKNKEEAKNFLYHERRKIKKKYGFAEHELNMLDEGVATYGPSKSKSFQWLGTFPFNFPLFMTSVTNNSDNVNSLLYSPEGIFTQLSVFVNLRAFLLQDILPRYGERVVYLRVSGVRNPDVAYLASLRTMTSLTELSLAYSSVDNTGLLSLITSPFMVELQELDFNSTGVDSSGIAALIKKDVFPKLKTMKLSYCQNLNYTHLNDLHHWAKERNIDLELKSGYDHRMPI